MSVEVEHNPGKHRFEVKVEGDVALLEYRIAGKTITMYHTEVPPAAGGQGIGGKLATAALEYARSQNLTVVPQCSFVADYIRKKPQYADLLTNRAT
ncbi:MAG TPA: GNAT family N-acetyltransferase [Acidisarcina sp.]